jgi:hypothetical protein
LPNSHSSWDQESSTLQPAYAVERYGSITIRSFRWLERECQFDERWSEYLHFITQISAARRRRPGIGRQQRQHANNAPVGFFGELAFLRVIRTISSRSTTTTLEMTPVSPECREIPCCLQAEFGEPAI